MSSSTTIRSTLKVSGTTISNNATPLSSSINVVGNIIGHGTAPTNLNYNAMTNKLDLTVYATNADLNNKSDNFSQKNNIHRNFTIHQQKKPKKTSHKEITSTDPYNNGYGIGTYTLYSSSALGASDRRA